jgi:hypothetical protein
LSQVFVGLVQATRKGGGGDIYTPAALLILDGMVTQHLHELRLATPARCQWLRSSRCLPMLIM